MINVIGLWAAMLVLFTQAVSEVASYTNEQTGNIVIGILVLVALTVGALHNRPTYGAEIEVIRKRHLLPTHQSLATWLEAWCGRNVVYEGYTHDYIHDLKVVSDGSLHANGSEVVLPVTEQGDYSLLRKVMLGLRGLASADRSCGFHAHIAICAEPGTTYSDLSDDDAVQAAVWLYRVCLAYDHFWSALCGAQAPSRRFTDWASRPRDQIEGVQVRFSRYYGINVWDHKSLTHAIHKASVATGKSVRRIADEVMQSLACGRYYAVNCEATYKYGTVEFRQHGGTTNPNHAVAWVKLMDMLVANCREAFDSTVRKLSSYDGESIGAMCDWLGLHPNDTLRSHWERRTARFTEAGLGKGQECSSCNRKDCDNDEYCPHKEYDAPEGFEALELGIANLTDECGDCGYEGYDCECGSVSLVGILSLLFLPLTALIGCGVGGYHWAGRKRNVKAGLKRLWIALSSRGKDSAGLAFRSHKRNPNTGKPSGNRGMWVHKAAAPSVAMTGVINGYVTPNTSVMLMHTRLATNGAIDRTNAHPHRDPQGLGVTVVHNGVVTNDLSVFKALKVKAETDCDSEAIAACLAAGGINSVVKYCLGSMSLIWTDDREGQQVLNFWTNGANPLAFGRLDNTSTGAVVVGSTQAHLKKAFRKRLKSVFDCTDGKHYIVSANGTITSEYIIGSIKSAGWYNYHHIVPKQKSNAKGKGKGNVKSDGDFHTWNVDEQKGVRPDGSEYDLPQYLDPAVAGDVGEVESGLHDPTNHYDKWMRDPDYTYDYEELGYHV